MIIQKLKKHFRLLLSMLFLFGALLQSYSQDEKVSSFNNGVIVGWEYPFFRTFSFGYQRMINETEFLKIDISFQPSSTHESYKSKEFMLMQIQNYNKSRVFTARAISFGYGQFVFPKIGFYVSGEVGYRYKYFENKYYFQCVSSSFSSKVSLRSEFYDEFEIKGFVGFRVNIAKLGKASFVADFNIGAGGVISIQEHLVIADKQGYCTSDDLVYYDEPKKSHIVRVLPTVVLRGRVGIIF